MKSVRISAKHAKALVEMREKAVIGTTFLEDQAVAALRAALKPRPVSSQRKKTRAKRETRKEETARIRETT